MAEFRGKGESVSRVFDCKLLRVVVVCRMRGDLKARVGLLSLDAAIEELDGTHVLEDWVAVARRTQRNQDVARQSQRRYVRLEYQLCAGILV